MFSIPDSLPEGPHQDPHKHGSYQATEIGTNATERETKVHALSEERVHTSTHSSLKILLQSVQKLPYLGKLEVHSSVHTYNKQDNNNYSEQKVIGLAVAVLN